MIVCDAIEFCKTILCRKQGTLIITFIIIELQNIELQVQVSVLINIKNNNCLLRILIVVHCFGSIQFIRFNHLMNR